MTQDIDINVADIPNDWAEGLRGVASQIGALKSDTIVVEFERQILSGALPAGTTLPPESELCELLGVSRTVLRDSVRSLVARGLLTVRQGRGRGTRVAEPSDAAFTNALLVLLTRSGLTLGEVNEARASIETGLVSLAATSGTDEEWEELERVYYEFAASVDRGDHVAAARAHAEFHNIIVQAIHQPALALILKPMAEIILLTSTSAIPKAGSGDWEVEAHLPILNALKARDGAAAARAMEAHFCTDNRSASYLEFIRKSFADAYFDRSAPNVPV